MLVESPESVNTISEKFNISRPAVSKHLKVLSDSQLIRIETDKEDARQRNCYAQLEALKEVDEFMGKLEAFWKGKLKGLGDYLKKT